MNISKNTLDLLAKYHVDPVRGFLPAIDPLTTLPDSFTAWENLAKDFTHYLNAGIIRAKILELPLINNPVFQNDRERERAMLLLSLFAHAFVNAEPEKQNFIPPAVSIPYVEVANQLGRNPVLAHASLVLNNWKRLDTDLPISLDNLTLIQQFHGGLDENWFYLVTVQIEKVGGPAIAELLEGLNFLKEEKIDKAEQVLKKTIATIQNMTKVLERMYENCAPFVFYNRIRPFLDSFVEVEYRGTSLGKQSFHGGSAAQSSLIQFFDAIMGNNYQDVPSTNQYLLEMRNYMPFKHRAFLEYIESGDSYRNYWEKYPSIKKGCEEFIKYLIAFRNEHLKIVSIYIMKQAKESKQEAIGTGGTNPMIFLKSIRNKNRENNQSDKME